jgi:hypothetical protein
MSEDDSKTKSADGRFRVTEQGYVDLSEGGGFLVLAPDKFSAKLEKASGYEWVEFQHQTAGLACHQHTIVGILLSPREKVREILRDLSREWLDSNAGWGGNSLKVVNEYEAWLQSRLDVSCDNSYGILEEGLYPIDATAESLKKLTNTELPADLDDLIKWPSDMERFCGSLGRWKLFCIGENCD